jgi:hypothetical protein
VRFVRGIGRLARWLSFAAATAAALLALALYDNGLWLLLAAAAAVPAVVLFLFSVAILEAAELPDRLRSAPAQARDLRAAVDELGRARGLRLSRALWRAGRQAAAARDLVTPWAPLLPLLSLPFLAATVLSALVTPVLFLVSLIVLATQL